MVYLVRAATVGPLTLRSSSLVSLADQDGGRLRGRLIGCRYLLGTDGPGAVEHKRHALFLYAVYGTAVCVGADTAAIIRPECRSHSNHHQGLPIRRHKQIWQRRSGVQGFLLMPARPGVKGQEADSRGHENPFQTRQTTPQKSSSVPRTALENVSLD